MSDDNHRAPTRGSETIAAAALAANGAMLMSIPGVSGVAAGRRTLDGVDVDCILVHVDAGHADNSGTSHPPEIPSTLAYTAPDGSRHEIPTVVEITGRAIATSRLSPASALANKSAHDAPVGTLGCYVYAKDDPDPLILTCYHVVRSPAHDWELFAPTGDEDIVYPTNGMVIGRIIHGLRDSTMDAALIRPEPTIQPQLEIPEIGAIDGHRLTSWVDVVRESPVRMNGAASHVRHGTIQHPSMSKAIYYTPSDRHILMNLILVNRPGNQPLGQPGDSGAVVLDSNGRALGMLVASDETYSYLTPMGTILGRFRVGFEAHGRRAYW